MTRRLTVPKAYNTVRVIAAKNVPKFFTAHLFLFLWQLFAVSSKLSIEKPPTDEI
jgi:hypothetical protein